jgi:hypothetical protein
MLRVQQHIFVLIDNVDDMQFDAQGFRYPQCIITFWFFLMTFTNRVSVAFYTKSGEEINALDMDALLHNHLGGEQRVESAGNE